MCRRVPSTVGAGLNTSGTPQSVFTQNSGLLIGGFAVDADEPPDTQCFPRVCFSELVMLDTAGGPPGHVVQACPVPAAAVMHHSCRTVAAAGELAPRMPLKELHPQPLVEA